MQFLHCIDDIDRQFKMCKLDHVLNAEPCAEAFNWCPVPDEGKYLLTTQITILEMDGKGQGTGLQIGDLF